MSLPPDYHLNISSYMYISCTLVLLFFKFDYLAVSINWFPSNFIASHCFKVLIYDIWYFWVFFFFMLGYMYMSLIRLSTILYIISFKLLYLITYCSKGGTSAIITPIIWAEEERRAQLLHCTKTIRSSWNHTRSSLQPD